MARRMRMRYQVARLAVIHHVRAACSSRRHDGELAAEDGLHEQRRDRVGDRVVHVQQVERRIFGDLGQARGEREYRWLGLLGSKLPEAEGDEGRAE